MLAGAAGQEAELIAPELGHGIAAPAPASTKRLLDGLLSTLARHTSLKRQRRKLLVLRWRFRLV